MTTMLWMMTVVILMILIAMVMRLRMLPWAGNDMIRYTSIPQHQMCNKAVSHNTDGP